MKWKYKKSILLDYQIKYFEKRKILEIYFTYVKFHTLFYMIYARNSCQLYQDNI